METREGLRPYKKKRLAFEGVLVAINKPTKRNGGMHELVFASVYAPHENVELDHVVIAANSKVIKEIKPVMYKRYHFTARVESYFKPVKIMNALVNREDFMLTDINTKKVRLQETSNLSQPTQFAKERIHTLVFQQSNVAPEALWYTAEELISVVRSMPNDGSVEKFISEATRSYQKVKFSKYKVIESLYAANV